MFIFAAASCTKEGPAGPVGADGQTEQMEMELTEQMERHLVYCVMKIHN